MRQPPFSRGTFTNSLSITEVLIGESMLLVQTFYVEPELAGQPLFVAQDLT